MRTVATDNTDFRAVPRVHFSSSVIAREHVVGKSVRDIANRVRPCMAHLRLTLGDAVHNRVIDFTHAKRALLSAYNFNDESSFLAPSDAERLEQHLEESVRLSLAPSEKEYCFLRGVLLQAWATFDPLSERDHLQGVRAELERSNRIQKADVKDALLTILALNESFDFLSENDIMNLERSLAAVYFRREFTQSDEELLYDMAVLALETCF